MSAHLWLDAETRGGPKSSPVWQMELLTDLAALFMHKSLKRIIQSRATHSLQPRREFGILTSSRNYLVRQQADLSHDDWL